MLPAKNKKIKVMVSGAGGPAGVNVCKLLKKYSAKFEIYACDISPNAAGKKFADHFVVCPYVEEKKALKWFSEYIEKNKIVFLIPTVAETLVEMEALQEKVEKTTKIIISDHETIYICHEKDKLYEWMEKNFGEYMGKWQKLDKFPVWKEEEYFIKPIIGRGSRGCRNVSAKELKDLLKNKKEEMRKYVAMEVLPGREWTVDCYVNADGTFSYIVPRLRLGLSGGISSLGKTDKNLKVIEQTKKILEKLKCRGPVFVQWKEDKNRKPKMVEINPRASGGLAITALSGGNMAESLMAEIKNKPICNKPWKEITVVRYFEEIIL
jgi:carbamoyl-phosphate synthase large subunit